MRLLREAVTMASDADWRPTHVDVTVIVEQVRVAPYRDAIRIALSEVLGLDVADISVKATTTDGLGFVGKGEGVAVVAVVTVEALS